jgi:hypothetical protein
MIGSITQVPFVTATVSSRGVEVRPSTLYSIREPLSGFVADRVFLLWSLDTIVNLHM